MSALPQTQPQSEPLVKVRDLNVAFVSKEATLHAVNGVDFDLAPKETLCILGESGSGKSVTLRSLMRLHPPKRTRITGTIEVDGTDIVAASERELSSIRGRLVSMIFQEPMTALDPVFTIGKQITETIRRHEGVTQQEAQRRALDLLELVQIPSARQRLDAYPHELSGGLRQRAMIAVALSVRPKLLLADEPTTALDATVQIQVLLLLKRIQAELGMGVIFVTHDLGVAGEIADRIAVMYAGRFIEEAPAEPLLEAPEHPYVEGLLGATVTPASRGRRLTAIPGSPPNLRTLPTGCAFAPRCPSVEPACRAAVPDLRAIAPDRTVRCIHPAGLRPPMPPAMALAAEERAP
ncbi:ABC transporter ATP-binding protein [Roseixanthobacter glucoisosaccharinicivorans]|uniref:ABC transporter ATP-binding protein n=1 Tax=Roseixanthobacter glucoisosaccharinicivorans TaxID=3119923 RepID=UPI00372B1C64